MDLVSILSQNPYFSLITIPFSLTIGSTFLYVTIKQICKQFPSYSNSLLFAKVIFKNPLSYQCYEFMNLPPSAVDITTIEIDKKKLYIQFQFCIPQTLCISETNNDNKSSKSRMNLGSILSLADQVTSYTFTVFDKTHRSGVSVNLSGEIHCNNCNSKLEHLEVGSIVLIESRLHKVGLNLGFSSMTMKTLNGELLATCNHLKYLPQGFLLVFDYHSLNNTYLLL